MNFIEVARRGGGRVRVRWDSITAVVEIFETPGDAKSRRIAHTLQLQLGATNHIVVEGESMDSLWNKMCVASGGAPIGVIDKHSPDYPGYPTPEAAAA